ncbi:MAG: hypothetical protein AB7K86_08415 [Rhodospirillales bacterium]
MFSLETQAVKITAVNPRTEIHGDEHVPAADISITFDAANDLLIDFAPTLRTMLFAKANKTSGVPQQGELDAVEPASDMPALRDIGLEPPFKVKFEGAGYSVEIIVGITGDQNIDLDDAKVGKIRITPKEGGTVTFAMQIQASGLDEAVLGRLCTLIGSEVRMALTPPVADQERIAA